MYFKISFKIEDFNRHIKVRSIHQPAPWELPGTLPAAAGRSLTRRPGKVTVGQCRGGFPAPGVIFKDNRPLKARITSTICGVHDARR